MAFSAGARRHGSPCLCAGVGPARLRHRRSQLAGQLLHEQSSLLFGNRLRHVRIAQHVRDLEVFDGNPVVVRRWAPPPGVRPAPVCPRFNDCGTGVLKRAGSPRGNCESPGSPSARQRRRAPSTKSWGAIAPQFRLSGSLVVPPGFCLRPDQRSGRAHPSGVPSNHTPRFSGREEADPGCRPSPASRRRGGRSPGIKVELRGSATLSPAQGQMHSPVTRHQLHPLVAPQVLHFMHVPLRTKV